MSLETRRHLKGLKLKTYLRYLSMVGSGLRNASYHGFTWKKCIQTSFIVIYEKTIMNSVQKV